MSTDGSYQHNIDEIYYEHSGKLPLAHRISFIARRRVVSVFFRAIKPTADNSVLDVGVSEEISLEANMLEQVFPYRENLVCASITSGKNIVRAYPGVAHVQIEPNARLPFQDKSFDIGYSNAVLEHVGSREKQRFFIEELCRVSKQVFLVVPNRWFPVEHHTGIPLLHWLPQPVFRRIVRQTRWRHWGEEENLNYIGAQGIHSLWPCRTPVTIRYEGVGVWPFQSNLVAYGRTL